MKSSLSTIHWTAACVLLVVSIFSGCSGNKPAPKPAAPPEVYDLRGEVVRIAEDQVVVVKHEDIKGWMKAMTMEFPVKDKAEFESLSVGDWIEAKVYVQDLDYWLGDIKVIPPPSQ